MDSARFESIVAKAEEHLVINRATLDDALVLQPTIFWMICDGVAVLDGNERELREHLGRIEGDLYDKAEVQLKEAGSKTTVDRIKSEVKNMPGYAAARDRLFEIERMKAQLVALKEAYTQRLWALRTMAELHSDQYWQADSASGSPDSKTHDDLRKLTNAARRGDTTPSGKRSAVKKKTRSKSRKD